MCEGMCIEVQLPMELEDRVQSSSAEAIGCCNLRLWMVRTELRSSARTVCVLLTSAFSLQSQQVVFLKNLTRNPF